MDVPFCVAVIGTVDGLQVAVRPVVGVTAVVRVIVPLKPPVEFIWMIFAPPSPEGKVVAGEFGLQK